MIGKWLIDTKIYVNRASSYVSMFNTGLLLMVVLLQLGLSVKEYIIPIYLITMAGAIFVGWLDVKLGLFKLETARAQENNEDLQTIKADVKKLLEAQ